MPNSQRPPDTTRQCCLCRVRRCELSLETVWQSLNSQPIDHPHRVAFSEKNVGLIICSSPQRVYICVRTTSLRVGGRALACVTAAAVDRQARQSCLQVRSASECVLRLRTHSDTDHGHRTHLSDGRADSVHSVT